MAEEIKSRDKSEQSPDIQPPDFREALRLYLRYIINAAKAERRKVGALGTAVLTGAIAAVFRGSLPGPPEIWLLVLLLIVVLLVVYLPFSAFRLHASDSNALLANNKIESDQIAADLTAKLRAESEYLASTRSERDGALRDLEYERNERASLEQKLSELESQRDKLSAVSSEQSDVIDDLTAPRYPGISASLSGTDQVNLTITNSGDGTGEFRASASVKKDGAFSDFYPLHWEGGDSQSMNIGANDQGTLTVAILRSRDGRDRLGRERNFRRLDMPGGPGAPPQEKEIGFDKNGDAPDYNPKVVRISVTCGTVPRDPTREESHEIEGTLRIDGPTPRISVI